MSNLQLMKKNKEIDLFFQNGVKRSFPKKTLLYNDESKASTLYYILEGEVSISIGDYSSDRVILLSIEKAGDYFGELGLMTGCNHTCATSRTPITVLTLDNVSKDNLPFDMYKNLITKIVSYLRHLHFLSIRPAYSRLKYALDNNYNNILNGGLTHYEIANLVLCSREMATLIMNELIEGGYIKIEKKTKRIEVLKTIPEKF